MWHKNQEELLTSRELLLVWAYLCAELHWHAAFNGCDTVSAFAGKGKMKMLIHSKDYQDTFLELGTEWDVSSEIMDKQKVFRCLLYAPKASSTKVNELRYRLFRIKRGEIETHQLPPCRDCLQHALRANYQAAIW